MIDFLSRKQFILYMPLIAAVLSGCGEGPSTNDDGPVVRVDDRPNIIFIFTDDHGYADLGAHGVVDDIQTPNLDQLAAEGTLMSAGYVTSPQCTPSRAGLMTGRYQQRFGVDDNRYTPMPLEQETLAEKLVAVGYKTGMAGKWHLEIDANSGPWFEEVYKPGTTETFSLAEIPSSEQLKYYPESRGFQDTFFGFRNKYRANYSLAGQTIPATTLEDNRFRVDVVTDASTTFIDRHKDDPFFLYVAYFAPHVPLEATEKYLSRFPEDMPERRRYALAMLAAIDDGVGEILAKLKTHGIDDNTIIFFMSDNGAPLELTKRDVKPVSKGGGVWDGSLNDPWIGEKGMLTEGALRVPYIVNWKGHVPAGLIYPEPVSTLDASTTAASLAGVTATDLDGINLLPFINNVSSKPERSLFWKFLRQTAVRKNNWKFLKTGNEGEYLFDLSQADPEKTNLINAHPQIAAELKEELTRWAEQLRRPGVPDIHLSPSEKAWYEYYF